ncbi:rhamnosyltransferase [Bosea rubneri]|uniref:Rhamnosyltransferase n=1 Tax=Bosea rubneri TaxID=3075434 RepID=A0ABU3SG48_9HYPH|nr:rhamnosyltransferase [Bosea sp. ZW T0_25]MDU0343762.1 rhamnosyltransferase [Bosea sp. ZW T0_25]
MQGARACAGVVLYRPDAALLARQAEGLRGHILFAFANGPVEDDVLAALAPTQLHLISSAENVGLGQGLNAVMQAAAAEGFSHVMLLDQDSEPSAGLLDSLTMRCLALEEQGEKIAVLAPRLLPPQEGFYKPIRYEWRGSTRADGLAPLEFAPTSGSLVSLAAFAAAGPFRDDFFIAGLDVEWGFRAWAHGWGSYLASDLAMPHRWGEAVSEQELGKPQILRHAPLRNYYYVRNVIATARLPHVPLRWRLRSCAGLAAQIGLLALKGPPGSLKPVRAGLVDGISGRLGPAPASVA